MKRRQTYFFPLSGTDAVSLGNFSCNLSLNFVVTQDLQESLLSVTCPEMNMSFNFLLPQLF